MKARENYFVWDVYGDKCRTAQGILGEILKTLHEKMTLWRIARHLSPRLQTNGTKISNSWYLVSSPASLHVPWTWRARATQEASRMQGSGVILQEKIEKASGLEHQPCGSWAAHARADGLNLTNSNVYKRTLIDFFNKHQQWRNNMTVLPSNIWTRDNSKRYFKIFQ